MHQTDSQSRVRVEPLAREEVATRVRPDLRQDERRDHRRNDSELHLRETERCVRCRDRDVGAGHESRAAAERVTLYTRDHRRAARVDRLAHAEEPQRVLDVLLVREVDRAPLPLDVRPGAEALAFTGEHHGASIPDVGEGFRQLPDQRRVEGVAPVRLRERHPQEVSVPLDPEPAHASRIEFFGCCEAR